MVEFYFVMRIGDALYYEYYPEGKDYPGLVSIMTNGKGRCILEVSKYPNGPEHWYWGHTLSALERMLEKNYVIPLRGMSAWY